MSADFEKWDATPYQPDPPAIDEAEREDRSSAAVVLSIALAWVLGAAVAVGACWVIWRALHL